MGSAAVPPATSLFPSRLPSPDFSTGRAGRRAPLRHTVPRVFPLRRAVCPREGAQARLGAGAAVGRDAPVGQGSPCSQLTPALGLAWGFPRWKGSGHGSRHLLQSRAQLGAEAAAGGCRRRNGSCWECLLRPCRSEKSHVLAARDSAVTRRTSPRQPLLTASYCLATATQNAEVGAKLPAGAAAARGLSSPSAFPQGRSSLERLSCQPRASCPGQTHLQTLPLQPRALVLDRPSFAAESPVAFSRCLSAKPIPGSA